MRPSASTGKNEPVRVVIDTNVWVSALLRSGGVPALIARQLFSGTYEPVLCESSFAELQGVLGRERLRRAGITAQAAADLTANLRAVALFVPDPDTVPVSRDHHDDVFIALAIAAMADCLVTRDDDLKSDPAVRAYLDQAGIAIYSVRQFVAMLGLEAQP